MIDRQTMNFEAWYFTIKSKQSRIFHLSPYFLSLRHKHQSDHLTTSNSVKTLSSTLKVTFVNSQNTSSPRKPITDLGLIQFLTQHTQGAEPRGILVLRSIRTGCCGQVIWDKPEPTCRQSARGCFCDAEQGSATAWSGSSCGGESHPLAWSNCWLIRRGE